MMGISKDVLIVHCDCNNKGSGIALTGNKNLNQKTNQNEHNFGNCCCKDK